MGAIWKETFPFRSKFRPADIGNSRDDARTAVMLLSIDLLGGGLHVTVIHRDQALYLRRRLTDPPRLAERA
jgi:hypothetical protein